MTFSDVPMTNGSLVRQSYKSASWKGSVANPCKGLTSSDLDKKGRKLDSLFISAGKRYSIAPALLKAVARAESCFDSRALSKAGAKGLMQLMPGTAQEVGVSNLYDTKQSLMGGAQYLAAMLDRYSADTQLALAAYNAGPGNVDRYKGIPPFKETQHYIKSVERFRSRYESQFSP